jgi:acid phosphatase
MLCRDGTSFKIPLRLQATLQSNSSQLNPSKSQEWNILYHLGGNGPWIPKFSGTVEDDIRSPTSCKVDQIHMVGLAH